MTDKRTSLDGVLYIVGGLVHSVLAAVSVRTLLDTNTLPVSVMCWDDVSYDVLSRLYGADIVQRIQSRITFDSTRRRTLDKLQMYDVSPFDYTIQLDADTVVAGDITDVFPTRGTSEVRLTSVLCDEPRNLRDNFKKSVAARLGSKYGRTNFHPIVNNAVMGFSKASEPFFRHWQRYVGDKSISTDHSLRTMYFCHPHVVLDDRYNCMPSCGNYACRISSTQWTDVRVWHMNGKRRFMSDWCRDNWFPAYASIKRQYCDILDGCHEQMPRHFRYYWNRYVRSTHATHQD